MTTAPKAPMTRRAFFLALGGGTLALMGCQNPTPLDLLAPFLPPPPPPLALTSPTAYAIDLVGHVLSRCTWGIAPGDREAVLAAAPDAAENDAVDAWIDAQLRPESIDDSACQRQIRRLESLDQPVGECYEWRREDLLSELAAGAILRARHSRRQLAEVMAGFWSDHFNIDISKGECPWLKTADDRLVARAHALGNFGDILRASVMSPAMLWYLDGRSNRAGERHPNENHGRELLELHTLGVAGGYTQTDVMEVARCLSGWTARDRNRFMKAKVEFDASGHDDGPKRVLGHDIPAGGGPRDLDDVLAIVGNHPATARHIATKLCRRFIADQPPGAAVGAVADAFSASHGDIPTTLRALFKRCEFREETQYRGNRLKRPFHLVISALRATDAVTDGGEALHRHLHAMGQAPFQRSTPDGYPDVASAWRGTVLWRWEFAAALAHGRIAGTSCDAPGLVARAGSADALLAHCFGRLPTAAERAAYVRVAVDADGPGTGHRHGLALAVAAPAFQVC